MSRHLLSGSLSALAAFVVLSGCDETPAPAAEPASVSTPAIPDAAGAPAALSTSRSVSFTADGNGLSALTTGWSTPESYGAWSAAPEAILTLPLATNIRGKDLQLVFRTTAFVVEAVPRQTINVYAGESLLGEWTYSYPDNTGGDRTLSVPAALSGADGPLVLRFEFPDAAVPKDVMDSEDIRQLGAAVNSVSVALLPSPSDAPQQ